MIGWLFLLAVSLVFAIAAWLRGRPSQWMFPSDAFFVVFVLVAGTIPFVNLYATSPLFGNFYYSDATVRRSLISLTLMFLTMGIVWMLRPKIVVRDLLQHIDQADPQSRLQDIRAAKPILRAGAILLIAASFLMLAYGPYLAYKLEVFRFLTGSISAQEYQTARRITYTEDFLIGGVMGRLRYAVFPMLFVALSVLVIRRLGLVAGFLVAALAFVVGPASMSKAPIVFYFLYFILTVVLMSNIRWPLKASNAVIASTTGLALLLILLGGIYFLQYREIFRDASSIPDAISLAHYRVLIVPYDGLLKYMTTYPDGDVGYSASIIAVFFGEETRNLDTEVATFFLGPLRGQLTSFPTMFVGNAYATFGYIGVILYSAIVATFMWFVDKIFVSIRNSDLRIVFYATMMVNVTFFSSIAALTSFLTYGNAIIPVLVLAADRVVSTWHPRTNGRFGTRTARRQISSRI